MYTVRFCQNKIILVFGNNFIVIIFYITTINLMIALALSIDDIVETRMWDSKYIYNISWL